LKSSGKIVNVAFILELAGELQNPPFFAAKDGLIQIAKALSLEWTRHDIQVKAFYPGV